jgi:hypothetical protein
MYQTASKGLTCHLQNCNHFQSVLFRYRGSKSQRRHFRYRRCILDLPGFAAIAKRHFSDGRKEIHAYHAYHAWFEMKSHQTSSDGQITWWNRKVSQDLPPNRRKLPNIRQEFHYDLNWFPHYLSWPIMSSSLDR